MLSSSSKTGEFQKRWRWWVARAKCRPDSCAILLQGQKLCKAHALEWTFTLRWNCQRASPVHDRKAGAEDGAGKPWLLLSGKSVRHVEPQCNMRWLGLKQHLDIFMREWQRQTQLLVLFFFFNWTTWCWKSRFIIFQLEVVFVPQSTWNGPLQTLDPIPSNQKWYCFPLIYNHFPNVWKSLLFPLQFTLSTRSNSSQKTVIHQLKCLMRDLCSKMGAELMKNFAVHLDLFICLFVCLDSVVSLIRWCPEVQLCKTNVSQLLLMVTKGIIY